jgi:hypothetical protein
LPFQETIKNYYRKLRIWHTVWVYRVNTRLKTETENKSEKLYQLMGKMVIPCGITSNKRQYKISAICKGIKDYMAVTIKITIIYFQQMIKILTI